MTAEKDTSAWVVVNMCGSRARALTLSPLAVVSFIAITIVVLSALSTSSEKADRLPGDASFFTTHSLLSSWALRERAEQTETKAVINNKVDNTNKIKHASWPCACIPQL